jgi:hypothetical protein
LIDAWYIKHPKIKKPCYQKFDQTFSVARLSFYNTEKTLYFAPPDRSGFTFIVLFVSHVGDGSNEDD